MLLDIERMYGKRQPIAVRKPLVSTAPRKQNASLPATSRGDFTDGLSTPPATEGETASETELETEVETATPIQKPSLASSGSKESLKKPTVQQRPVSEHDLHYKYFRRDAVGLLNIDLLRYGVHPRICSKNSLNNSFTRQVFRCDVGAADILYIGRILSPDPVTSRDSGLTLCSCIRLVHSPHFWLGSSLAGAKQVQVPRSPLPQELCISCQR